MLIQYILIVVVALIILRLIFKLQKKDINSQWFVFWLVIWLIAIVIIWRPEITSYLAIKLGVTRGVDLVVYVSVVVIFYLMFRLLSKIYKIEKDITKIIRHISLKDEDKK